MNTGKLSHFGLLVISIVALAFAGCTLTPRSGESESEVYGADEIFEDQIPAEPENKGSIQHRFSAPVLELWEKAENALAISDYDTAVTQLERALRINPEDAIVWSRLAEVNLDKGNANQAENLAAKSNAMTADNPTLNYRNWLIIAQARKLKGDEIGAQEAEYTANTFKEQQ